MKNWLDGLMIAAGVTIIGVVLAIPIIFYGSIAYVVIHFIKKLW